MCWSLLSLCRLSLFFFRELLRSREAQETRKKRATRPRNNTTQPARLLLKVLYPFTFLSSSFIVCFSLSTFCALLVQTQEGTRNKSTQPRERKGTLHTSPHPLFSLCLVLFLPFKKFPAFAEMQAKRSLQGTPFSLSSLPFEFVLPFKVLRKKQHGHQEVIIMCSFLPHFLSSSCLLVVIS